MAELNGEFGSDRALDISGYETPDSEPNVTLFNEKVAALEQENRQLVHDKEVIEKRIEGLKQSLEVVNSEKEKLVRQIESSKAEIETLESVGVRASDLEGEVSRLQHDLISTTSALEETNSELTDVKLALEESKKSENGKREELDAVVKERDLLIEKLGKLEATEGQKLKEMNAKEKELRDLWDRIEELKSIVAKNGDNKREAENVKKELEARIGELERKLQEKEKVIDGFEANDDEMVMDQGFDGMVGVRSEGKEKELVLGGKKMEWLVIAGSVVGAAGLVAVACYLRYSKKD